MSDNEEIINEIREQLKNIPRNKHIVFGLRSAMRVLPILQTQQGNKISWFWQSESEAKKLLLDVYRAYSSIIFGIVSTGRTIFDFPFVGIANIAYNEDAYAVGYMYRAIDSVCKFAGNASSYAFHAAKITANVDTVTQEIKKDFEVLEQLSALELLQSPLWSNSIPDDWQKLLDNLKVQTLKLNAGFEIWLDWYDDRLQGKPIDIELLKQWNNIPVEIEAQGVTAINAYLKHLTAKNLTQPLNRVRAIFIGYGEAGKTSLIRALHGEEIKEKEPMTPGIEIRDWDVPETEIKAHFWDFGGQVVFHSTHKFFLRSSCVYIIVINARANINNSEQAEYWLDHIKVFGGSAPVLLVGNKADEAQIHLQMETLKLKYPNLKGYYPVSCTGAKNTYKPQFEIFKQALTQELQAVGIHQVKFTPAQGNVLDELRKNSLEDAFLTKKAFQQLCDKYAVSDEGALNRNWLVKVFDSLGVMLHFEDLERYFGAYMLNPRWLTFGVNTLMNAKKACLTEADMVRILANAKVEDEYQHLLSYPADKCLFISKAMQYFKLCYPLPNRAKQNRAKQTLFSGLFHKENTITMLIPALLCDELDLTNFKKLSGLDDTLQFEFAFSGFLPRNLIGEFMVSRYQEIKDNLQSQRGAIFKSRSLQAKALVEADYHRRLIIVQVYGRDAKEYLTILYDAMKGVFGDLALEYTEIVYLPKSACLNNRDFMTSERKNEKADYKQLLEWAKAGQTIWITSSGLRYDLGKVLGFILSKAEQAKQGITIFGNVGDINMNDKSFNGTATNSNINFGNNSTLINTVQQSQANNEVKQLLEQLLNEIKALNGKIPEQAIQTLSEESETLITEAIKEQPRKKYLGLSLEGIKEAALMLKEIGEPIVTIAAKLSPLLLNL